LYQHNKIINTTDYEPKLFSSIIKSSHFLTNGTHTQHQNTLA